MKNIIFPTNKISISNDEMKYIIKNKEGFTLIEVMIVLAVLAIMALMVVPRLTSVMNKNDNNFKLFLTYITKTFDDAFLNDKTNFLVIHLYDEDPAKIDENEILNRRNGISVVNLDTEKNNFTETKSKILKNRKFGESFKIEKVLFPRGETISKGYALVPFFPHGFSENAIIHILADNEEQLSIRIYKHHKEPEFIKGYAVFEESKK